MGGRMDATYFADCLVSDPTRVELEHTEHLGKTVNRIARETAGIVKPSSLAVTVAHPALSVIEARCREVHAPLLVVGRDVYAERGARDLRGQDLRVRGSFGEIEVHTPLLGDFQAENVALAVTALTELRQQGFAISDDAIRKGIASTRWPARLELVRERPLVVVDGAHNPPAAEALATSIAHQFPNRKTALVVVL